MRLRYSLLGKVNFPSPAQPIFTLNNRRERHVKLTEPMDDTLFARQGKLVLRLNGLTGEFQILERLCPGGYYLNSDTFEELLERR